MTDGASGSSDRLAERLRGFGPIGILAFLTVLAGNLLFPPLSAVLALIWAKWSRTPWSELGFVRPRSWVRTVAVGVVFGAAFKLASKVLVMPLLGAPPVNAAYHHLVGNTAALPGMIAAMIIVAGFGEETLFRGFLFQRLRTLFGTGAGATALIVVLTAVFFGSLHYPDQGLPGVEQAVMTGLVFGAIYAA
ncbi:MAG TPA: CPBP family intramembrane glutamic endopeptidase, partial [Myxococcales bacterium]|nr:CPBP family intramembrane glutamic endopeptidase [Myxococcales bacterium]